MANLNRPIPSFYFYIGMLLVNFLSNSCAWSEVELDTREKAKMDFFPKDLSALVEGTESTVRIILTLNHTQLVDIPRNLYTSVVSMDPQTVEVSRVHPLQLDDDFFGNTNEPDRKIPKEHLGVLYSGNFSVFARFLGRTRLKIRVHLPLNCTISHSNQVTDLYDVTVFRKSRPVDTVFIVILIVLVTINNVGFGCRFDIEEAKVLYKKPLLPIFGFLLQAGMMPVIAYLLGLSLRLTEVQSFGLLTMGTAPGGGQSTIWNVLLGADTTLGLCLSTQSALLVIGTMPLWLLTLGQFILGSDIHIPYSRLLASLLGVTTPMVIGILIKRFFPNKADLIRKTVRPLGILTILFISTVGVYAHWYVVRIVSKEPKVLAACVCLPWVGSIIGGSLSLLLRLPVDKVKTIAIETAFQNAGLSILVLRTSLPQPEADLTVAMPGLCIIFTPVPFALALLATSLLKCRWCTKEVRQEEDLKMSTISEGKCTDVDEDERNEGRSLGGINPATDEKIY